MEKLRRISSSKSAPNPPGSKDRKATSLLDQIGALASLMTELPEIARTADRERLSVLIDAFERDYPEMYESIQEMIELPPVEARDQLIERWPRLGLVKMHPDHLQLIELIQAGIKARKKRLKA